MVIFFIVTVIFLIVFLCCLASEESVSSILGVAFTFGCIISMICNIEEPSAMDVYRGKTTLEYTIVDGEKIDSVVIYRK